MQAELIKHKGSVQDISSVPEDLKQLYKTTWEIKQRYVIDHAARRGKYICQSQSLNLYFPQPSANQLSSAHFYAWKQGLKTGMYYLRAKPASEALNFSQEEECESCGS
jgi:ribonucleotide reductase alpha subunit